MVAGATAACGGDSGTSLPACTGHERAWTVSPVDLGALSELTPLGNLNPPSHTFPTDHFYFYVDQARGAQAIVSPGDLTLTVFQSTRYVVSPFRQGEADYALTLQPCDEVRIELGHVETLDPALEAKVGAPGGCSMYSTADETVERCLADVDVPVAAGEVLGTGGVAAMTSGAVDFGVRDTRKSLTYANPDRVPYEAHVACPLDYFDPATRSSLEAAIKRTGEPRCGRIDFDVAATAAGIWVRSDIAPMDFVDGKGLALVRDTHDPSRLAISIGMLGTTADGQVLLGGAPGAPTNVDFPSVTPGSGAHCYDGFSTSVIALVELTDATHLRFEVTSAASCGGGPWALGAGAISLVR